MSGGGGNTYEGLVSKADDLADRFLRNSKHYLPHLARLCLVSTFLEDGLRMWFQWTEQKDYINLTWRCGEVSCLSAPFVSRRRPLFFVLLRFFSLSLYFLQFLGHLFVIINMVLQVAGCCMVLIRKYVTVAVGMLFGIVILQVCKQ